MGCKQVAMEPKKDFGTMFNRTSIIKHFKQDCVKEHPNRTRSQFVLNLKRLSDCCNQKTAEVTTSSPVTIYSILDPTDVPEASRSIDIIDELQSGPCFLCCAKGAAL